MAEVEKEQRRPEVEEEAEVGLKATTTVDMLPSNGSAAIVTGPRILANGVDKNGDPGAQGNLDISGILDFDAASFDGIVNGKNETLHESNVRQVETGEPSGVVKEVVEEEIVELEFEKAILKLGTHTMHCPKCDSEVTKVVLRRRVIMISRTVEEPRDPIEKRRDPDNLVGCFSCFSLFTCSENGCFNPFNIFGKRSNMSNSPPSQLVGNEGAKPEVHENENCFSMFWVVKKEQKVKEKEDPLQTDIEHVNHGSTSSDQLQTENTSIGKGEAFDIPHSGVPGKDEPNDSQSEDKNGDGGQKVHQGGLRVGVHDQPDTMIDVLPESGLVGGSSLSHEIVPGTENLPVTEEGSASLEILKSIVYGGLMEVIASLSVVTSAAASDAATLSIIALALATLVGGIFVIGHNLWDLRDDCYKGNSSQETKKEATKKYKDLLGRLNYFPLHAVFAILSFLVFGMIPPVAYGVSFHETNDKDYTIVVVAIASLLCVSLLAIFKAYINTCKGFFEYVKTMVYYITTAVSVSGVSYVIGILVTRLMEELGLFDTSSGVAMSLLPHATTSPLASF